jgi:putative addiction module CopG family antidote
MPMTVDLGEMTEVVDALVQSGRYESRDAVLADAVRTLQKREADRAALLAEIQVGIDAADRGELYDADEAAAFLAERRKGRSAA